MHKTAASDSETGGPRHSVGLTSPNAERAHAMLQRYHYRRNRLNLSLLHQTQQANEGSPPSYADPDPERSHSLHTVCPTAIESGCSACHSNMCAAAASSCPASYLMRATSCSTAAPLPCVMRRMAAAASAACAAAAGCSRNISSLASMA